MKTNRQLLTEIRKGRNVFDVIAEERKEATENLQQMYKDAFWLGALETKFAQALQTIKALEDEISYEATCHKMTATAQEKELLRLLKLAFNTGRWNDYSVGTPYMQIKDFLDKQGYFDDLREDHVQGDTNTFDKSETI